MRWRGFTLIEVSVTIAVIAVVAAVIEGMRAVHLACESQRALTVANPPLWMPGSARLSTAPGGGRRDPAILRWS